MQTQLFCTKANYCDFVVHTEKGLHIEHIEADHQFMEENLDKANLFFQVAVLPELFGRWFSRPVPVPVSQITVNITDDSTQQSCSSASGSKSKKYCYCQQEELDGMISSDMHGCDNDKCTYEWFHLKCLNLKSFPRTSKWYCPDCRKIMKKKVN